MTELDPWLESLAPAHRQWVGQIIDGDRRGWWREELAKPGSTRQSLEDSFWHVDVVSEITRQARSHAAVADGVAAVLRTCTIVHPDQRWDRFESLDVASDHDLLRRWLLRACTESAPGPEITGLWFGLFNPVAEDSRVTCDMYISGSPYDPDDDDWRCSVAWKPDGAHARSLVLSQLYSIAYPAGGDAFADAEWALGLAYAALVVRQLVVDHGDAVLGTAPQRVITVGFDSGDLILIGAIGPEGLVFSEGQEGIPG